MCYRCCMRDCLVTTATSGQLTISPFSYSSSHQTFLHRITYHSLFDISLRALHFPATPSIHQGCPQPTSTSSTSINHGSHCRHARLLVEPRRQDCQRHAYSPPVRQVNAPQWRPDSAGCPVILWRPRRRQRTFLRQPAIELPQPDSHRGLVLLQLPRWSDVADSVLGHQSTYRA